MSKDDKKNRRCDSLCAAAKQKEDAIRHFVLRRNKKNRSGRSLSAKATTTPTVIYLQFSSDSYLLLSSLESDREKRASTHAPPPSSRLTEQNKKNRLHYFSLLGAESKTKKIDFILPFPDGILGSAPGGGELSAKATTSPTVIYLQFSSNRPTDHNRFEIIRFQIWTIWEGFLPCQAEFFDNKSSEVSCEVILQQTRLGISSISCKSNFVCNPHHIFGEKIYGKCGPWVVLPCYHETLDYHLKHNNGNVYAIVQVRGFRQDQVILDIMSFSENFKSRFLEIFKGIKAIHVDNHTHGNINGNTMILCLVCDNEVVGKVIGTSIDNSGDKNDDWKAVAKFLRSLILKYKAGGSKFDFEIANLIDVLESDRVNDDEVVEHIALWLAPRKYVLIKNFLHALMEKHIIGRNCKRSLLGTVPDWRHQFDNATQRIIYDPNDKYNSDVVDLVRFVRNVTEHGFKKFEPIKKHFGNVFDFDEKGIFGMIDKMLPGFFMNILKETSRAGLPIPDE